MENKLPEHQNQPANRAAYARLAPALEAWRSSIGQRVAQMQGCKHTYVNNRGVFICQKCGQPAPIEDEPAEYW